MSCNGCRILRKGCSDTCILRPCLPWIETSQAQANATVFLAKFFGRTGLMSFISAVPPNQRPTLFQSLLFEAAGRTVNPVTGAVGLFRMGNWHVCQKAVETILRGGTLNPIPELLDGSNDHDEGGGSELPTTDVFQYPAARSDTPKVLKRRRSELGDLDLSLTTGFPIKAQFNLDLDEEEMGRVGSPGMDSEESVVTTNRFDHGNLLNLFN